ncbi:MAG: hypothetical protein HND47_07130 [Chloroflexi bacterium]|nr:hypothetical protein [Chloroflexota bacterium]
MSNNIPKVSLEDSLYVLQLARETALAKNRQAQAERMNPVVEQMRGLIANANQAQTGTPSTGVMGQSDFKALLNIAASRAGEAPSAGSVSSVAERNRLIGAMAQANMSEVDIARQFGMSREEVRLILGVQQKNRR